MPKTSTTAVPIMENEYVIELLEILKAHKSPSINDFNAVLGHVAAMEKQLEAAVSELAAMRRDLAEAEKHNHPIKNTMQKAVIAMQGQVLDLREKLAALKQSVIDGCKNALAAFKEKGISALDNIARFFKIKPILETIHTGADKAAQAADRAVANIEAASTRYHEAELHMKNAGRALKGKEAEQDMKPSGKIAKVFTAPFRATRFCFKGIRNNAVAAVGKLNHLEEQAAEQKQKKPSIYKTMEEHNRQIAEKERAVPVRDRPVPSTEL
ncbi:MAG: hypothetical protein LBI55_02545 [Oscillospiraceae bacterium]|jgi:hypothetical protein|nr:hypothetical protein [Oscillospiraceae bacterium]